MLRHMVYAFRMLWLPLDALDRLLRRSSRIVESKWAGCAAKLDSDLLGSPVQASDGDALCLNPRTPDNQSKEDLVITKKPVGDFEFSFEWKMSLSRNGGGAIKSLKAISIRNHGTGDLRCNCSTTVDTRKV